MQASGRAQVLLNGAFRSLLRLSYTTQPPAAVATGAGDVGRHAGRSMMLFESRVVAMMSALR